MKTSELIRLLTASVMEYGDLEICEADPTGYEFIEKRANPTLASSIEPVLVKEHHGGYYRTDALYEGTRKAFQEPYQSQLEAKPNIKVFVI